MVRSSYHLIFGLLSPSIHHQGSLSSREDVIEFLSQQADIKTTMKLITAPSAPAELLKMDSVSFCFLICFFFLFWAIKRGQDLGEGSPM